LVVGLKLKRAQTIQDFREARELALRHITEKNTRYYTQYYGARSYQQYLSRIETLFSSLKAVLCKCPSACAILAFKMMQKCYSQTKGTSYSNGDCLQSLPQEPSYIVALIYRSICGFFILQLMGFLGRILVNATMRRIIPSKASTTPKPTYG
jgi:hypothetical protein